MSRDIPFELYSLEEMDEFENAINGAASILTDKNGKVKAQIDAATFRAAEYVIWLAKQSVDLKRARKARAQLESSVVELTREVETLKSDLTGERLRRGRAEKQLKLLLAQAAEDDDG